MIFLKIYTHNTTPPLYPVLNSKAKNSWWHRTPLLLTRQWRHNRYLGIWPSQRQWKINHFDSCLEKNTIISLHRRVKNFYNILLYDLPKYNLSQIKMMMQILVNNKGHMNVITIPLGLSKLTDTRWLWVINQKNSVAPLGTKRGGGVGGLLRTPGARIFRGH